MRGRTERQQVPADAVVRARTLRREAGEPERRLWRALREALPEYRFRRQVPFGPYHADFCSHAGRLILEVDGDDHALKQEGDAARTRFLNRDGYRVIRCGNADVMDNIDGVVAAISLSPREREGAPQARKGEGDLSQEKGAAA